MKNKSIFDVKDIKPNLHVPKPVVEPKETPKKLIINKSTIEKKEGDGCANIIIVLMFLVFGYISQSGLVLIAGAVFTFIQLLRK